MSTTLPARKRQAPDSGLQAIQGVTLLAALVGVMWFVEIINTLDSNNLNSDGIWARDVPRLWGIVTSPFLHASFQHLIANTIPFVFMGLIIAMRGAVRLALVTAVVVLIGGFGTWLIAPDHSVTIGASGVVFGYATYLLTRGAFDRSPIELLTGIVVAVVWGGALLSSLVPHYGVSWQAHLCGAIAGVIAAWILAEGSNRGWRSGLPGGRRPSTPSSTELLP